MKLKSSGCSSYLRVKRLSQTRKLQKYWQLELQITFIKMATKLGKACKFVSLLKYCRKLYSYWKKTYINIFQESSNGKEDMTSRHVFSNNLLPNMNIPSYIANLRVDLKMLSKCFGWNVFVYTQVGEYYTMSLKSELLPTISLVNCKN